MVCLSRTADRILLNPDRLRDLVKKPVVLPYETFFSLLEYSQDFDCRGLVEPKVLLPWSENGLLEFIEIEMSPAQLLDSSLVTGSDVTTECWDLSKRRTIAERLLLAGNALSKVGVTSIVVSGEFVERLADPVGIEGFFEIDGSKFAMPQLHEFLKVIEPRLDWSALLGKQSESLVNLYPVLLFKSGKFISKAPTVPTEGFYLDSEGRKKGVVRLSSLGL